MNNEERMKIALEALRLASNQGAMLNENKPENIVKAAEIYHAFLVSKVAA